MSDVNGFCLSINVLLRMSLTIAWKINYKELSQSFSLKIVQKCFLWLHICIQATISEHTLYVVSFLREIQINATLIVYNLLALFRARWQV